METTQAQTILANIGLLDPPADGMMGPVTKWALGDFCARSSLPFDGSTITNEISEALEAAHPLALRPGDDLAGRMVSAMLAKNYFVARSKNCLNIVYVEGINPDSTLNGNRPNYFDSVRCLIRIDDGGIPKMAGIWEATTEPSRFWTENPMNEGGAARVAFGQYKSWAMGDYHGDNALIQAADITIYRDPQKLYKRYGPTSTGEFGIHHHHGYNYPKNDEGRSSAGCLVGRLNDGHEEFMSLVRTDARYKANPNYKFLATILPAEALSGAAAEPTVNRPLPPPAPLPVAVVTSSADKTFDAYRPEYAADWQQMAILPGREASVRAIASKLLQYKPRYQTVAAQTGVPWYVIAVLHQRESGADFTTHLHNGDPLTARTVHVPAGRPRTGSPPFTWEASAIDALTLDDLNEVTSWPIERVAYECEKYNGWGYRKHGVPSAYLWSFSNIYHGGKYVADGVWSASAQDQQCGVMPLISELAMLDPSVRLDGEAIAVAVAPAQPPPGPVFVPPPVQPVTPPAPPPSPPAPAPSPQSVVPSVTPPVAPPPPSLPVQPVMPSVTPSVAPPVYSPNFQSIAISLGQLNTQIAALTLLIGDIRERLTMTYPASAALPVVATAPVLPPPSPSPAIDGAGIAQEIARIQQIAGALAKISSPSSATPSNGTILSPIDKALGGQAMVGLKTPLAIAAYAGLWITQALGAVGTATGSTATTTGQVLTALIAAFGGLGLSAKADRAVKALGVLATAAQSLPVPPSPKSDGAG